MEQAGANKVELLQVLDHYRKNPADSLKLKAAYFLIENMPFHYSSSCRQLDLFDSAFFKDLASMKGLEFKYKISDINAQIVQSRVMKIWKNTVDHYGDPSTFPILKIPDQQLIKAKLLIENIDYAFETLKFPWTRHLSFDEFCEYVLPYKFDDEPLESWRPFFMERYKWIIDSISDQTDPVEVCTLINNDIALWLMEGGGAVYKKHPRGFSPSQLTTCKIGFCYQQAASASFAMRAMGLAIARNKIPNWGNRSTGHEFSSVLSKDDRFIDFLGGVLPPGKNEFYNKPPKIYRETFSMNHSSAKEKENIKPFNSTVSNQLDVTDQYVLTSTFSIDLPKNITNIAKEIYLCVFDNKNWVPVQCTPIHKGKCVFDLIGRDIVYLPTYYKDGNYVPFGNPFLLTNEGKIQVFEPNNQIRQEVKLYRKYPLFKRIINYTRHMIGGKFQGATNPDFSDANDLYIISSTPAPFFKSYPVKNGMFQYLRYVFPPFSADSAIGNVAEIGFIGMDGQGNESCLYGKYIGNHNITRKQFEIIFDKKQNNYVTINTEDTVINDYPEHIITTSSEPLWVGMDLNVPRRITHIGFCPRNDTNSIYDHCTYELFYWDKEWISLGTKKAQENYLIYSDVPENALFWLHNHTEGKEERIFIYENNEQVWW